MSEVAFTEPLHERIAGLAKELYLLRNENSNLRDNVGEQAARIADLEDEVSLQKTFNQVADLTAKDDYARISTLEARLSEAVKVLEPFVRYLDEYRFDIDNNGNPLPDETGPGWTYLTAGDFRAAKAFLATLGEENHDG